jgi:hypothetical protein
VAYEEWEDFAFEVLSDFVNDGFGGIDFDAAGWGGADALSGGDAGGGGGDGRN